MMKQWLMAIAGVVILGAAVFAFLPGESPSETLKRTQKYVKLVGVVQTAQDQLNSFIEKEKKVCQTKGEELQLNNQGMLQCVVPQKATAPGTGPGKQ